MPRKITMAAYATIAPCTCGDPPVQVRFRDVRGRIFATIGMARDGAVQAAGEIVDAVDDINALRGGAAQ